MKAFTFLELIFVILILSLLSLIAVNFIPDNSLALDRDMLITKILEKRSNALAFKANMDDQEEKKKVCITFDKESLNSDEKGYKFKSNINTNEDFDTICFDSLGRPFKNSIDYNLSNLIHNIVIISLNYKSKEENISIYPITGFIRVGN